MTATIDRTHGQEPACRRRCTVPDVADLQNRLTDLDDAELHKQLRRPDQTLMQLACELEATTTTNDNVK